MFSLKRLAIIAPLGLALFGCSDNQVGADPVDVTEDVCAAIHEAARSVADLAPPPTDAPATESESIERLERALGDSREEYLSRGERLISLVAKHFPILGDLDEANSDLMDVTDQLFSAERLSEQEELGGQMSEILDLVERLSQQFQLQYESECDYGDPLERLIDDVRRNRELLGVP